MMTPSLVLRTKLALAFALLFIAPATLVFVMGPQRLHKHRVEVERRNVAQQTELLALLGDEPRSDAGGGDPLERLGAALRQVDGPEYVVVLGEHDERLFAWSDVPAALPLDPGQVPARGSTTALDEDAERIHVMTRFGDGVLLMGYGTQALEAAHRENLTMGSIVVLVVFMIGVGVSVLTGTLLVRPLRHLTKAATEVSEGRASLAELDAIDRREGVTGYREASELRDAIRRMARAIDKHIQRAETDRLRAREAEARARQASAAKSRFLANMSHELRTPLNAILGLGQVLADGARQRGDDDTLGDIERLEDAGERLLGMISAVLELTQIEAGPVELDITEFGLVHALDECAEELREAAARRRNEVVVDIAPALRYAFVRSDRDRLQRCVRCLLDNAIAFTEGGTITLRASTTSDRLLLEVADTGAGVPQSQLERIFDAFTQADESFTRAHGGIGLGLTLCSRIGQLLGGSIEVTSTEGVGTCFTLSFERSEVLAETEHA